MPQTWIFERASERIVVSRHSFVNCTHLIVVAHDGTTRSRSFDTIDDAIPASPTLRRRAFGGLEPVARKTAARLLSDFADWHSRAASSR